MVSIIKYVSDCPYQKKKIPLLQANAFSMMYGALAVFFIGLIIGKKVIFETNGKVLFKKSNIKTYSFISIITIDFKFHPVMCGN